MGVLRNDMIVTARRFMKTGLFDPHVLALIEYIDQHGNQQSEQVSLVDLARDVLYRKYDGPKQNHPSYVPQTRIMAMAEVLFRYNYFFAKKAFGLKLARAEREFLAAVEAVGPDAADRRGAVP